MKKRYSVEYCTVNRIIIIHDSKGPEDSPKDYYPAEFVYGCGDYNEETERYPEYVHCDVADLVDKNRHN